VLNKTLSTVHRGSIDHCGVKDETQAMNTAGSAGFLRFRRGTLLVASGGASLAFGVASLAAASAPSFAPPKQYVTGKGPISIAIGDLNGDGKSDLATANGTGTISVLLNSGGGRFRAPRGYPAGRGATRIAVGDLNGDRKLDLLTVNIGGTVSVLVNNAGGAFLGPRRYAVGERPHSLAVADLNGDGKPDVAALANDVSVLLNRGDGSFKARLSYASGGADSIAVADLNGDRATDIVTEDFTGRISVFLNRGDGTFRSKRDYQADILPFMVKGDTLASGDLNGDGKADLAIPNYKGDSCCGLGRTVSVFINAGDGSFPRQRNYRTDRGPESVAIADLNGDRKLDIVTVNDASSISLLLGRGDGTFQLGLKYPAGTKPYSGNHWLGIGDLNGDTRLDVVSANQSDDNVSVLLARMP
jgi:hypothetical protein